MKKQLLLTGMAGMLFATSGFANFITDPTFAGLPASGMPEPTNSNVRFDRDGDQGWFAATNLQQSFDDAGDEWTLANGTSWTQDATPIDNTTQLGWGQATTDNFQSTGQWSIEFDVVEYIEDGGGGAEVTSAFVVFLYENNAPTPNGDGFSVFTSGPLANTSLIGSVTTPNFSDTGTYQTDPIDLGTGYEEIGVGIWMYGDGIWADSVTLGSIEAVAVPEPATFAFFAGLLGLGLVLRRRRRRA
ncbi:MAG: PEP-CTERM sorting domain-containing protein [Verrucomicrobia bacterium]|jgi:hypothetical protein|nr:PEP-CTERM sorting domain-containing protein [Verrucomicrobiota bacterium]